MNEIVQHNNDMNTVAFRKFNASELDLLMTICHKMRDKDIDVLTFDFGQLKALCNYTSTDTKDFVKALDNTYNKLLQTNIRIGNDVKWTRFVLFTKYTIDTEKQTVTIGVNKEFQYILNELTSEFTRFELKSFVDLKSSYAKECFRHLKQFRTQGWWEVPIEEFRRLLDVPESYTMSAMDKWVFKPIQKELAPLFLNFKMIKKYKKGRGRGGKVVSALRFEFKAEKVPKKENNGLKRNFERTEYKKTGMKCPACGEILYEAVLNGNNCWCHNLKEQGDDCKKIYNSIAEIKELPEHPGRGSDDDDISDKEYSRKLIKEMIKKLG